MRLAILLLAFAMLFVPISHGQSFALVGPSVKNERPEYSATNFMRHRDRPKQCAVTIIGYYCLFASPIVGLLGFAEFYNGQDRDGNITNKSAHNFGGAVLGLGMAMCYGGIGMWIGGAIHDHRQRNKYRWGMVSPGKNQVGFAYNF